MDKIGAIKVMVMAHMDKVEDMVVTIATVEAVMIIMVVDMAAMEVTIILVMEIMVNTATTIHIKINNINFL